MPGQGFPLTIFTTASGVGISSIDTGKPDGDVLVLLHGMGEGGASWEPLLPAPGWLPAQRDARGPG